MMIKDKLKNQPYRQPNDYRTSRFFARMLSIFGWAFLIVWILVGVRYGAQLGQEIHAQLVKYVSDGIPLLLVNLFLVMWLLALVMFGFMFVVAGQGMRAVFEMANSSKHLVRLAEEEIIGRRRDNDALAPALESKTGDATQEAILDAPGSATDDVAIDTANKPATI